MPDIEQLFRELLTDTNRKRFIEELLVIEDKQRQRVPFTLNPIQQDVQATQTGRDIWLKPAQVGFSSERIATRMIDTLTIPGTNTILIAYEDFITERLLSKVEFFYYHLESLEIPGFPRIHHDSTYEKTFRFYVNNRMISKSSIYIASARSYVAGRAETIHHLLADEFGFWAAGSTERILSPAIDRVPPDGTVDIFSTPNGEDNDFCDMYRLAMEGKSVFKAHFYPWFMHPEYQIRLGDLRINRFIAETNHPEFSLSQDEQRLMENHKLTYDQIRWRRWKIKEKESLRRTGETRMLFSQEFPEDDVSCFLATGDMYYDTTVVDEKAKDCYPTNDIVEGLHIWYRPEEGKSYLVTVDPGQGKVTQSVITVLGWDAGDDGDVHVVYCARDAGFYTPEITAYKAKQAAILYNNAKITWEANSHGLALSALFVSSGIYHWGNIYYRRDIITGKIGTEIGWLTTSKTKDYVLHQLHRALPRMRVHDIEFISQLRNIRQAPPDGRASCIVVGADDIHDSVAIGVACHDGRLVKVGCIGRSGWKW